MKRTSLIALLFAALIGLASCVKEDLPGRDLHAGMGRIEISMGGECFIETKASTPVSQEFFNNIRFTISGKTKGNVSVTDEPIDFSWNENGTVSAYFRAGTYTLKATYQPEDANQICYSGVSNEFTVEIGGITGNIRIDMTPANSRVNVIFDDSLFEFYSDPVVNFTSPRDVSVTSSGTQVYFPVGSVTYNVSAKALTNSGSQTFTTPAHNLNLSAGNEYTITVKATPGGEIIFTTSGDSPTSNPTSDSDLWDGLFS